jgi:hemolysin activation/secretion protein
MASGGQTRNENKPLKRAVFMQLIKTPQCLALCASGALALGMATPLMAQVPPTDAGRLLEQTRPAPQPPAPAREAGVVAPPAPAQTIAPGGAQVSVQRLEFAGHTLFTREQLLDALQQPEGKSYDMSGLQGLADALSDFYRESGYPFARAVLPPQTLDQGVLLIEVVEGRYGDLTVSGVSERFTQQAQPFLYLLKKGEVITAKPLERTTLVLEDLPGIRVLPVLRPSETVGAGDIEFVLTQEAVARGVVGLDNHGNRLTGYGRAKGTFAFDSPFRLGDQLVLNAIYSSGNMVYGGFTYGRPVGGTGLRTNVGYTRTDYELGREFTGEGFKGKASVYSVGLEYPVVRSQKTNVTVVANLQYKALRNEQFAGSVVDDYHSAAIPLSVTFDHRDTFGGSGGVTYGALTVTPGRVTHSPEMRNSGKVGHGNYSALNIDLARIQSITPKWTVLGRFSSQWSSDALDSSEYMSIGGAERVRAFPSGEAGAMQAFYTQLELRYTDGIYAPYLFVDAGMSKTKELASRRISGAGFGMRVLQLTGFNLDTALAWRISGKPTSDTDRNQHPLFWLSLTYRY